MMTKKRHESAHPGRQRLYEGRIIDLNLEHVHLPGGQEVELEIVRHPGGAAVVAIDAEQRVCLLRQFRHAADGWLWELPAGKLDPGEAPEVTALRELAEEAGVEADRLTSLGIMHSSPGVCTEIIHLYMARDLSTAELNHEHGEVIEVHWEPLSEVLIWCDEGKITDAKTLVGLYRAAALLRE
jgi:8-oxo-dGTP pyrophosphatase MutT (NUDIX family)